MKTLNFKTNINCNGCIGAVTPHLHDSPDIIKWKVDIEHPQKILTVEVKNIDAADVSNLIKKAGFNAEVIDEQSGV